jgi:hypothetical protein
MNDPDAHQKLAQEIYVAFCKENGPDEWDWQALANKAFDAADNFQTVSIQRMNPQAATPPTDPTAMPIAAESAAAPPSGPNGGSTPAPTVPDPASAAPDPSQAVAAAPPAASGT